MGKSHSQSSSFPWSLGSIGIDLGPLWVVDNEPAVARLCQKDQRTLQNAVSSLGAKEVLVLLTIHVFIASLYQVTKSFKGPRVKEAP